MLKSFTGRLLPVVGLLLAAILRCRLERLSAWQALCSFQEVLGYINKDHVTDDLLHQFRAGVFPVGIQPGDERSGLVTDHFTQDFPASLPSAYTRVGRRFRFAPIRRGRRSARSAAAPRATACIAGPLPQGFR